MVKSLDPFLMSSLLFYSLRCRSFIGSIWTKLPLTTNMFLLKSAVLQSCGHQTIQSHRSASHLSFWKIRLQDGWFFHDWFFPGWLFQWVIRLLFSPLRQSKEEAMVLGLPWQILLVFGLQRKTSPLSWMQKWENHHRSTRHSMENYEVCNRCETHRNSNQRGLESFGGTSANARIGKSLLILWALHDSF